MRLTEIQKEVVLFLLGAYGHALFLEIHALITYCPPNLFSGACVIILAICLIVHWKK